MSADCRRPRRIGSFLLTALFATALVLTAASAAGLGIIQATAAPPSDQTEIDNSARTNADIFSRRTPGASLSYYPYYLAFLPLASRAFYPYYRAIVSTYSSLVGVFAFGSIFTCVLGGLVISTRQT